MSVTNPYLQYQQNAVQCSSPGELLIMLYDGLVKFLKLAIDSIEKKDMYKANNSLKRSQDIIKYLIETLDGRYEVSNSLLMLYDFMSRQLITANVKKDTSLIQ